jgi:predicted MFS family arabinose efflux permease
LFGLVSDVGNVLGPVAGVVLYELTGRTSFILLGALSGLLAVVLATQASRWRRHFPTTTATTPERETVATRA